MATFIGKDGKEYDNANAWLNGDAAYDKQRAEQQAQINLLKEQNNLIKLENQKNLEFEKEKLNQQREMQIKQLEHDEKMRLLKIFDDVGISKETYDTFIDNLFGSTPILVEAQNTIKNNNIEITANTNELKSLLKKQENKSEIEIAKVLNKLPAAKIELKDYPPKILQEYRKWFQNPNIYKEELKSLDIYDEIIKVKAKDNRPQLLKNFAFWGILSILLTFAGLSSKGDFLVFVFLFSLIPTVISFIMLVVKSNTKESNQIFAKGLDNLKYIWNYRELNITPKQKLKDYMKSLDDELNNYQSLEKENSQNIKNALKNITPRWKKFNDFRKKHYNSKMEKLFIDTGLKNTAVSLGLEYPTVNNNTKISNGTIEDYIAYFETEIK